MKYLFLILFSLNAAAAGKILDADIAPSGTANIARNKLAASTAHNAATFDASGFLAGGIAPGSSGNFFGSNGTDWISSAPGNLTDAGTDGITVTSGTGALISSASFAQHVADTTHNGYLLTADWNTFNGKQAAGSYLTALTGDGTASGPGSAALTLATVNGSPGSFGDASHSLTATVNGKGLITALSANSIQIAESQVTSLVADLAAKASSTLTSAHLFVGNGSNVATDVAASGDLTLANTGAFTIANSAVTNAKIANSTIDLTAKVTGVLPYANGGTGQTTKAAAFDALQPMTTSGDIIYGGASGTGTRLAKGTDGQVLTLASGLPSWAAAGTDSPLTTKGDLYGYSTVNARIPVGTDGQVMTADSTQALGVKWAAAATSPIITSWASFTPTLGSGFGTPTAVSFFWRRVGDTMFVKGYMVTGTIGAGPGSVLLPGSNSIDTTKITLATSNPGPSVGTFNQPPANGYGPMVLAADISTTLVYTGNEFAIANHNHQPNFNTVGFSSTGINIEFSVPILGW